MAEWLVDLVIETINCCPSEIHWHREIHSFGLHCLENHVSIRENVIETTHRKETLKQTYILHDDPESRQRFHKREWDILRLHGGVRATNKIVPNNLGNWKGKDFFSMEPRQRKS